MGNFGVFKLGCEQTVLPLRAHTLQTSGHVTRVDVRGAIEGSDAIIGHVGYLGSSPTALPPSIPGKAPRSPSVCV